MEIRRSYDRLISTMGFPILVRLHFYIESAFATRSFFQGCLYSVHPIKYAHSLGLLLFLAELLFFNNIYIIIYVFVLNIYLHLSGCLNLKVLFQWCYHSVYVTDDLMWCYKLLIYALMIHIYLHSLGLPSSTRPFLVVVSMRLWSGLGARMLNISFRGQW